MSWIKTAFSDEPHHDALNTTRHPSWRRFACIGLFLMPVLPIAATIPGGTTQYGRAYTRLGGLTQACLIACGAASRPLIRSQTGDRLRPGAVRARQRGRGARRPTST